MQVITRYAMTFNKANMNAVIKAAVIPIRYLIDRYQARLTFFSLN